MGRMNDVDLVVLVDAQGNPTGTAPKSTVHTHDTPLHLAFSCYVLGPDGKILVTRRALSKKTWPGVWTNSACGHLLPHETAAEAAMRRVPHEIGLPRGEIKNLVCVCQIFGTGPQIPRESLNGKSVLFLSHISMNPFFYVLEQMK